jgi:hypothetical protein
MPDTESFPLQQWSERIAHEFAQCPALQLTIPQASRLWALPLERAALLLHGLARRGLLMEISHGRFVKRGGCPRCE